MARISVELSDTAENHIRTIQSSQVVPSPRAGLCALALEKGLSLLARHAEEDVDDSSARDESLAKDESRPPVPIYNYEEMAEVLILGLFDAEQLKMLESVRLAKHVGWPEVIVKGVCRWAASAIESKDTPPAGPLPSAK